MRLSGAVAVVSHGAQDTQRLALAARTEPVQKLLEFALVRRVAGTVEKPIPRNFQDAAQYAKLFEFRDHVIPFPL